MKTKTEKILLDRPGVDRASEIIQSWMNDAKVTHQDILRVRLTMEELLSRICECGNEEIQAELRFRKSLGSCRLRILYDGALYDPTKTESRSKDEMEEWLELLLTQTGFLPTWRRRGRRNELQLNIPTQGLRTEFVMLGCVIAAIIIGLLGAFIPGAFKTGLIDYALSFLTTGFLNLLKTFVGLMIFL